MDKKLSEQLKDWRAERPDEWKMDEFIRCAIQLEEKVDSDGIQINQAIDLTKYRKNSLIIAQVSEELITNEESANVLRRNLYDLKNKFDTEDSTSIWVLSDKIELTALDEDEMKDLGWVRK